jgi:protein TonB
MNMKSVMAENLKRVPNLDDIVFAIRNKDYGAYVLRKLYTRHVVISLMTAIAVMSALIIIPFLNTKATENRQRRAERLVEIKLLNLDQPAEQVAPLPQPPPPAEIITQVRYVPPVVVDTIKPDETMTLMTADQAQSEVKDINVVEVVQKVSEEVQENATEAEPFVIVEEMPAFPGGPNELLKWISQHVKYPEVAAENNIQGRVYIKFCVTVTGGVDRVLITKGVDPELDAEAIRVVELLPPFKPGRQGGKPVPVWYSLPIIFQIQSL